MIDDYSKDNSINIIENFQKKDKRIILLKNKYNKGTFIARNLGIIYSRGKYIGSLFIIYSWKCQYTYIY